MALRESTERYVVSPGPSTPAADYYRDTDRRRGWIVTLVITALAAVTRFAMLRYPTDAGTPVFDEKHYAPQGWQVFTGGGIEDNPGYGLVVHPPVGKQLIAVGEALFGYNGWGWRFSAAVAGTLLVLIVIRIVRRLARSTLVGAIAGILLTVDGVTFVSSRIGMLDIFLAFFVTAAMGCLVVDRDDVRRRMAKVQAEGRIAASVYGPRMGVRWWRFGAGILLGLACGTKWSGIYFIVFFGLLSVAFDLAARRASGVQRPWIGTAVRDIGPALYALVVIPLIVYLCTYAGWFASETSVNRHAVGNQIGTDGPFSFVPAALRSLWYYSGNVLTFHSGLTNSAGNVHPWESKPWTWPMGLRPMLYYFAEGDTVQGCSASSCVKAIMLIGTPAMWWLAVPMLLWCLWMMLVRRDWRFAVVLTGYGAAYLPWFATLDRQMYYFYAVALAPFMVMGFALILGQIIGRARASVERRGTGLMLVCLYVALVVANFIWLWPILTGMPITPDLWQQQLWLPSWR
ncbi:phospholipid carrier-dependent glycosyltransferase [Rhodococcus sp. RS1C4]|uniref:dolichyl-phosphate-mannose--protein mannosyltransferase n=1 Tax=Nocardiaceae TaxID=85025 RepID=UPI000362647E|nr:MULTISPECIES: phospholipid carrier-dependent glycosyltransferase [Rhodococcus]OZC58296.1 phospholipid carrier-dependent glycosyltransferase [Rhodococcus sp. RS1C4]OZD11702.1 phospholipid carrier-dependent glycosyltransferase [Rhodococcus sp. 06-156-4C]OZD15545.1 phospholipid carrier-dependent glycosyltransferase [Rhodococcus sp. 06-156-4a]OZD23711.1 phospholipid carrier-dependent glycosyltransferase [Rhodococcus sp. 06-156-3C]OZD27217.1 phospholipid carrier-dependent glycosyltransferase [Rh